MSLGKRGSNLSNNLDISEDALINIQGIERYKMPLLEKGFQMIEETDSEDNDDDDNDNEQRVEFIVELELGVVLYRLCIFYCTFMIFDIYDI